MLPPFNNISSHVYCSPPSPRFPFTLSRRSSPVFSSSPTNIAAVISARGGLSKFEIGKHHPETKSNNKKNSHARNATIFHTSRALIFFFFLPLLEKFYTIHFFFTFSSCFSCARLLTDDRRWLHLRFCAPSSFAAYALIFLPIFGFGSVRVGVGARFHRLFSRIKTYDFLFLAFLEFSLLMDDSLDDVRDFFYLFRSILGSSFYSGFLRQNFELARSTLKTIPFFSRSIFGSVMVLEAA